MQLAQTAILLISFSLLLGGCSGLRIVDSQVSAFSKFSQAPAAGAAWAFERLPSQQGLEGAAAVRQTQLENWAAQELSQRGFAAKPRLNPSSPTASPTAAAPQAQYTVQIHARVQRLESGPYDQPDPWINGHGGLPGRDYVVTGSGRIIYLPVLPRYTLPWYVREVTVLIRDAKSQAIVYETQAKHEGRWSDDEAVLPAMLSAALQGFPTPPAGPRMINIEIPR